MQTHLLEWLIFLLILCGLIYALMAIKKEKTLALKHAQDYQIGAFHFRAPSWWTLEHKQKNGLIFHRTDTYYEWKSFFWLRASSHENENQVIPHFLEQNQLKLDSEAEMTLPKQMSKKWTHMFPQNALIWRIEGMGTFQSEKRIYLDLFIVKIERVELVALSFSSVLNGMLEGPYFELVMQSFNLDGEKNLEFFGLDNPLTLHL